MPHLGPQRCIPRAVCTDYTNIDTNIASGSGFRSQRSDHADGPGGGTDEAGGPPREAGYSRPPIQEAFTPIRPVLGRDRLRGQARVAPSQVENRQETDCSARPVLPAVQVMVVSRGIVISAPVREPCTPGMAIANEL